jgi:transposase-like protein
VKAQALALYAGGMSVRAAGRFVGVTHQTVANWVEAACVLLKVAEASGAGTDGLIAQVAAGRAW